MSSNRSGINRRDFLKESAIAGFCALASTGLAKFSYAATKERLTALSSIGLDTLHPYAHSSSPQYGIWHNMIEPLVEVDYAKKIYYGVLAESWEYQGKRWVIKLRKNVRFHDSSPFTAKDVVYSINRMKNDKESLQKENFRDFVEVQAADDHTVIITTEQPVVLMLDRLQNRFILAKPAAAAWRGRSATPATTTTCRGPIGERKLLPAARSMGADTVLAAAGTSCRHQVQHFTGVEARHPALIIRDLLETAPA